MISGKRGRSEGVPIKKGGNTNQVFSMGLNREKESGHDGEEKKAVLVPTLVQILEGLEIVQVASGDEITIFLTSEGEVLEIGEFNNESEEPFLKHEFPEPIVKIEAGGESLYALSSLGNVFAWRENQYNQLGFPGRGECPISSNDFLFLRKKPES